MSSKQRSIKTFFKASNAQCGENLDPNMSSQSPPSKRIKGQSQLRPPASSTSDPVKLTEPVEMGPDNLKTCQALSGALHPDIGPTWFHALKREFQTEKFKALSDFLLKERQTKTIFPPHDQVWAWTQHFELKSTKVVILGQDPYHGPNQANGLCFSVKKGVSTPPSLLNIYKELEADIEGFRRPSHGDLSGWARQGVLLLNACLTVPQAQANAHKDKGWEAITDAIIQKISNHCEGVVFLLWGAFAQKKAAKVDCTKHHLLKSVHPSPLSAHRGFLGCKHFSKCNELLQKSGQVPIDWAQLD
ncbi:uracil-DNA glycosylase-like [Tigriopus californicus]|uniref:uracil-DNA glycosylase-like n=1 Tax=Tigriopus californicus TaxID=6832 RepID=UPI0027DA9407|nr:uracil-DNA glycosylase-like [Tigriopus californicus]